MSAFELRHFWRLRNLRTNTRNLMWRYHYARVPVVSRGTGTS